MYRTLLLFVGANCFYYFGYWYQNPLRPFQVKAPGATGDCPDSDDALQIQELQRKLAMLKLDHDRVINENAALTVELQNLRATQNSDGPPSDNDDGLSDVSTDAARKRLFRMVKRAADGQLVCSFSYVLC